MWCLLLLTLFATAQGRAVNISNTWVLPEEGFPVFYRYFRDRISWYEADAVCQFHHANLVTVDTTAQYDAVRAYLKELDISSALWVGLIRSNPDGDFTWTDYRGLSGDGYWSSAPDARSAPLCAAADPAADYRWEARACGGPSVASFICELPVPQWALGNEGCMVRALPALTVLYLPESAAVQLTADCGLAGVKRVQCTGNVKREDLLRELACAEEDLTTTSPLITTPIISVQTATETTYSDQDVSNEINPEENTTTEHEDDINQSTSVKPTITNYPVSTTTAKILLTHLPLYKLHKDPLVKSVNLDVINDNILNDNSKVSFKQIERPEDEKHLQHNKLHAELARLGNLETIFNQPTDHFVPPLVMAKAKIHEDMTALSIEEKLAQQLSEHQFTDHYMQRNTENSKVYTSTESSNNKLRTENERYNLSFSTKINDRQYTSHTKNLLPKKYTKDDEQKTKMLKNIKLIKTFKSSDDKISNDSNAAITDTTTVKSYTRHISNNDHQVEDDTSLELTVIIREPRHHDDDNITLENHSQTLNYGQKENSSAQNFSSVDSLVASPTLEHKVVLNDEVIKIEIINNKNKHPNIDVTVFEVTTKIPVTENNAKQTIKETTVVNDLPSSSEKVTQDATVKDLITASIRSTFDNITLSESSTYTTGATLITVVSDLNTKKNITEETVTMDSVPLIENNDETNITHVTDDFEKNITDTTPEIDDFQSPLLSAANEPLHKPNRSRRPQSQNRVNKFNPFRILG